jgi:23S rRNA pseudouridine2457 synthase
MPRSKEPALVRQGSPYRLPDSSSGRECASRVAGWQPLDVLLAAAGLGTRHDVQILIAQGRVTVDGRPTRDVHAMARPRVDRLALDGQPVRVLRYCRYIALHKPYNVLCAFTDPEGRVTLKDHVPVPDVYAAGRLDYDSEGLLLLSDDGWLLHRLTQPRYEHPKTYLVQVERIPENSALEALRRGVVVQGYRTQPAQVELLAGEREPEVQERSVPIRYRANIPTAWLRLVLREGRKRQIRHMTAAVGHPTLRLIRVGIGPITLGSLAPGEWRELTDDELEALARALATDGPGVGTAAGSEGLRPGGRTAGEDPPAAPATGPRRARSPRRRLASREGSPSDRERTPGGPRPPRRRRPQRP